MCRDDGVSCSYENTENGFLFLLRRNSDKKSVTENVSKDVSLNAAEKLVCDLLCQNSYLTREELFIGESWGSYLGIMLAKNYPQDYAAFIGSGQMVDFAQTEIDDCNLALKLARERGDTALVNRLETRGTPPCAGGNVALDSMAYLGCIDSEKARNPSINPFKSGLIDSFMEPEFGLIDKYNCIIGFMHTFNTVYPQLYGKDLRKDVPVLDVPVYFLLDRHDINAPLPLAEEYYNYNLLTCPQKELIWFEHSGHNPWNTEAGRYMQEVRRIVAATQASAASH